MDIKDLNTVGIDGPREGKLIINVFTTRSVHCKFIAPILHKLRDEGLINLIQIDLIQNRPLGEMFNIVAVPFLLFFKDGKLFEKSIDVEGAPLFRNGIMIGVIRETILRKLIEKMDILDTIDKDKNICSKCGKVVQEEEGAFNEYSSFLCYDCGRVCNGCGGFFTREEMVDLDFTSKSPVCKECYEEMFNGS